MMNLDKIIAELRREVESINEAIVALQRLVPTNSEENGNGRSSRSAGKKEKQGE